jgi:hypothetical protein
MDNKTARDALALIGNYSPSVEDFAAFIKRFPELFASRETVERNHVKTNHYKVMEELKRGDWKERGDQEKISRAKANLTETEFNSWYSQNFVC